MTKEKLKELNKKMGEAEILENKIMKYESWIFHLSIDETTKMSFQTSDSCTGIVEIDTDLLEDALNAQVKRWRTEIDNIEKEIEEA